MSNGQHTGGKGCGDPASPRRIESTAASGVAEALRLAAGRAWRESPVAPQAREAARIIHRAPAPTPAPGRVRSACADRSAARRSAARSLPCSRSPRPLAPGRSAEFFAVCRTIAAAGLSRIPTPPRSPAKVHSAAMRLTTSSAVNIGAMPTWTARRSLEWSWSKERGAHKLGRLS